MRRSCGAENLRDTSGGQRGMRTRMPQRIASWCRLMREGREVQVLRSARDDNPILVAPRQPAEGPPPIALPGLLSAAWTIARKDLAIEFRTRTAFLSAMVFALLGVTIFYFAWDPTSVSAIDL